MDKLSRSRLKKYDQKMRASVLGEFVDIVAQVYHPVSIYAFGSIVTDSFDDLSDVDLLLVFFSSPEEASNSWRLHKIARRQLSRSLDVVALDLDTFNTKKDIGGIAYVATHEGKLVYEIAS